MSFWVLGLRQYGHEQRMGVGWRKQMFSYIFLMEPDFQGGIFKSFSLASFWWSVYFFFFSAFVFLPQ